MEQVVLENQYPYRAAHWVHDVCVIDLNQTVWGRHSLILNLPATTIEVSGLSDRQADVLKQAYTGFVIQNGEPEQCDTHCRALRLNHPLGISSEDLTRDGLYSPKICRQTEYEFTLTGINFESVIRSDVSSTEATLAVASEEDLVLSGVFENFLRVLSSHQVLQKGGVALHSAGLVFSEQAYIFSGPSNAGKTTLTHKAHKKGARVLSDDINLVLPDKDEKTCAYDAYAVPFTGEFGRTLDHAGGKDSYPVAGIILLEQSNRLETHPVTPSMAVARLLTGCPFVNTDEHESDALFNSVTGLVSKVPVIRLLSQRDDDIDDIMVAVKEQFKVEERVY